MRSPESSRNFGPVKTTIALGAAALSIAGAGCGNKSGTGEPVPARPTPSPGETLLGKGELERIGTIPNPGGSPFKQFRIALRRVLGNRSGGAAPTTSASIRHKAGLAEITGGGLRGEIPAESNTGGEIVVLRADLEGGESTILEIPVPREGEGVRRFIIAKNDLVPTPTESMTVPTR